MGAKPERSGAAEPPTGAEPPLIVGREGRVATLRLNRPEVLNALDPGLVGALVEAVEAAGRDPGVGCLLISGSGRAFSAGGDLTAMLGMDAAAFRTYIEGLQALSLAMWRLRVPSVAALQGHVLAGGFELAIECDIRVAADDASFGLPDTRIGLSPTSGMSWLLPRIVGEGWARHLLLTAETIDVATAERIGLVTRVVPRAELDSATLALAQAIADQPPEGLRQIRADLDRAAHGSLADALAAELEAEVACFGTRDFQANLRAFAERRRGRGS
jgi:enoyl-CoA hydratase/carnithine racemase